MTLVNRRTFLQSTAASAGLILTGTAASGAVDGANDRVRIAVAGLNGRGKSHIDGWFGQDNVEIAYLIDPDEKVLARTVKAVQEKANGKFKVKGVRDVREALDDPNLDAISVATPNHWHSLITIWAAQAGKHVYVEKPMSHDVVEGRVAVEAQKKYGVVIQHGTQRRSDSGIAGLHEAIQAGKWGKLKISYGYCCKPRGGIGFDKVSSPPENLDWNLWRGPAEIEEFHANYHPYNWHWFWKTGNGDLNNQGTHQLDVARWAIDKDQTHPVRAMAIGGRFQWGDQGETPNTMFAMAEYPNGQYVFFNVRNVNYKGYEHQVENEYYFEDGGRIVRGVYYPKGSDKGEKVKVDRGDVTPGGNWGSFITAVRAGDPSMANGNVHDAHYACVLGHLMNNSYRLGEEVPFNAKAGKFGDNKDAAEHFGRLHEIMSKGVGVKDNEKYTVGPALTFDPETERHTGDHAEVANKLLKDPNRKGFEIPDAAKV
ncbi:1,5-anhydro-D-fructose reductase [Bremerella volcania]|uniref:1,5-anhydro-D-fructose reductase n=1 Tax=Bremerella volcania TaxID=2527984 RepID=A0A518CC03_9BACT|nr:Gfo/Idh/MocA family oxidoreductase [Bremerella volcania]QDU76756.1 1,5-anhydro-D-fructose reductase [Bremerella volcania]